MAWLSNLYILLNVPWWSTDPWRFFRIAKLGRFQSPSRFRRSIMTIHKGVWLCGIAKGEDRITRCSTEALTFTAKQRCVIRFPDIYMAYMRRDPSLWLPEKNHTACHGKIHRIGRVDIILRLNTVSHISFEYAEVNSLSKILRSSILSNVLYLDIQCRQTRRIVFAISLWFHGEYQIIRRRSCIELYFHPRLLLNTSVILKRESPELEPQ